MDSDVKRLMWWGLVALILGICAWKLGMSNTPETHDIPQPGPNQEYCTVNGQLGLCWKEDR